MAQTGKINASQGEGLIDVSKAIDLGAEAGEWDRRDPVALIALVGEPLGGVASDSPAAPLIGAEWAMRKSWNRAVFALDRLAQASELSESGREFIRRRVGADAIAELDRILAGAALPAQRERLADLRADLGKRTEAGGAPSDRVADKLESLALRAELLERDDAERVGILWSAVEEADGRTLRAFLDAPRWLELVPPDVLDQAVAHWQEATSPEKTKVLRELEAAIKQFQASWRTLRADIASRAGIEADLLAELADDNTEPATAEALAAEMGVR